MAFPDWLKVLEIKPRFLFAGAATSLAVLFIPDGAAMHLGLDTFRSTYRPWIGGSALIATVLWSVHAVPAAAGFLLSGRRRRAALRDVGESLSGLSPEEALPLLYCISRQRRTVFLPLSHSGALSLENKGLLQRATGMGSMLSWPFTIPSYVWDYLQKNREMIAPDSVLQRPDVEAAIDQLERAIQRNGPRL